MKKKLSEMTLEELWQLFPIVLTEHKSYWRSWFEEELTRRVLLMDNIIRISHIGSTAINSIWAKPIVDILIEVDNNTELETIGKMITQAGYIMMDSTETRFSYNRGYTSDGFSQKVFHLHLRCFGDNDELYFRDYLNEYPDIAHEYESLKLILWKQYEHDRDKYTKRKTDFVRVNTEKAILRYGSRYR